MVIISYPIWIFLVLAVVILLVAVVPLIATAFVAVFLLLKDTFCRIFKRNRGKGDH